MIPTSALALDYRAALLRYLPRREEVALRAAYELGRSASASGVSLLELVQVHHEVLVRLLADTPAEQLPDVGAAAAEFLLEVLATYDMAHRGFLDRG